MTTYRPTYLRKSCSFGLPSVPFVNCCQFMYLVISLSVLRAGYGVWLCRFLIIAYLFTFNTKKLNVAPLLKHFRWFITEGLFLDHSDHILTQKKRPRHIYVNFLQTNAVVSFNYFVSRNVIIYQCYAPKRNSLDAYLRQRQRRKHHYPNYESHIIHIWRVFNLHCSPQHIPASLHGPVAELLWVPGVFLVITNAGIRLPRNVIFVDVFPLIKREKSNVLTFFQSTTNMPFEWSKIKCQISLCS